MAIKQAVKKSATRAEAGCLLCGETEENAGLLTMENGKDLKRLTLCAGCIETAHDELHDLTEESACLFEGVPRTPDDPASWRCAKGHDFVASYNEVKAGKKCPECR